MSRENILWSDDPDTCWETNEYKIDYDAETGQIWFGSDGGCSCYSGFDEANFQSSYEWSNVKRDFGAWATALRNPAAAWEEYMEATRKATER